MTLTDVDAYADQKFAAATASPKPGAPQGTPVPASAPGPAAPSAAPAAPAAPGVASPSQALDEAAFQAFAQQHGGILSMGPDPKDAFIESEEPMPGPAGRTMGQTQKTKKPNPNPRTLVVFNDKTSMAVQRPAGTDGTLQAGYVIVDPGTAHAPPTASAGAKTPQQTAAELAQTQASARNLNADATAQEDRNAGKLTPAEEMQREQQAQANILAERNAKLKEIEVAHQAGQLDLNKAKEAATAAYQKYNADMQQWNAKMETLKAKSTERNTDVRVATDIAQATTSAATAALPYTTSQEGAAGIEKFANARLQQAGITDVSYTHPKAPLPFDPKRIAQQAMANVLGGRYGTTEQNPLPERTGFDSAGPPPDAPKNAFSLGTEHSDQANAAMNEARRKQAEEELKAKMRGSSTPPAMMSPTGFSPYV